MPLPLVDEKSSCAINDNIIQVSKMQTKYKKIRGIMKSSLHLLSPFQKHRNVTHERYSMQNFADKN